MKTLRMKNGSTINFVDSGEDPFVGSEHSIMFEIDNVEENDMNVSDYQKIRDHKEVFWKAYLKRVCGEKNDGD